MEPDDQIYFYTCRCPKCGCKRELLQIEFDKENLVYCGRCRKEYEISLWVRIEVAIHPARILECGICGTKQKVFKNLPPIPEYPCPTCGRFIPWEKWIDKDGYGKARPKRLKKFENNLDSPT